MRILHIWNTAGVGSLMARELQKLGHQTEVIMRKSHDPFGITEHYGHCSMEVGGPEFINNAVHVSGLYDLVHVHGLYRIVATIKSVHPWVKVVLQHHGTELTQCEDDGARKAAYKSADAVIASTVDLSEFLKAEGMDHHLLENAVDTDLFKPSPEIIPITEALMYQIRYLDFESSMKFAQAHCDWTINVKDREAEHVPYQYMPNWLNHFTRFVDVKCYDWTDGQPGKAYSKTGREALACGLEVLNYRGEIVKGLPREFTPEVMVEKLVGIYEKLWE